MKEEDRIWQILKIQFVDSEWGVVKSFINFIFRISQKLGSGKSG